MSRFGRRYSEDPRDENYRIRTLVAGVEPAALPLYAYVWAPPSYPRDQGQLPQCVGYAARGLLDVGPVVNAGGPSAAEIYGGARTRDEWPGENYDGTSARGAMKYLQELGFVGSYAWAWDVETIRLWHLSQRRPTMLGIYWYDTFDSLDGHGFATITERSRVVGGHEVLTVGWDDRRGALRCLNSWGEGWGERGRFWLSASTLARLLREDGDCVTPVEERWPGLSG